MQPVNLWRETTINPQISVTYISRQIAQITQKGANLCNLWISLYTARNAPESLKSANY
jgi:hypothetical protein